MSVARAQNNQEMKQWENQSPDILEATIDDIQQAYRSGSLPAADWSRSTSIASRPTTSTGRRSTRLSPSTARRSNRRRSSTASSKPSGPVGPLHGIPVIVKDQADVKGLPTTLGSVLFKDYYPDRDSFVVEKLKQAGALILAKSTLGEMAGGDTHGSLFGSTRNPYDLDRTVGGSSGGSAAAVTANLCTVAIGQEGLASIRRPAAWNCVAGMRTTAGLVSRTVCTAVGRPLAGSLGPMTRTVADTAAILDVIVGYDPEDPLTGLRRRPCRRRASGVSRRRRTQRRRTRDFARAHGHRLGARQRRFQKVSEVFDNAVGELKGGGRRDRRSNRHPAT